MKKLILLTIYVVFTTGSYAQQFDFNSDTVELLLEYDKMKDVHLIIDNTKSSDLFEFNWKESNRDFSGNISEVWDVQFCDCQVCYEDYLNTFPSGHGFDCYGDFGIKAGKKNSSFTFYVNPKKLDGVGYLSIAFKDKANSTNSADVTFKAWFSPFTSVNDIKSQVINFDVYPNPAISNFNIYYDVKNLKGINVKIYSIVGNEILNNKYPGGTTVVNFSTSKFESGIYFVQILSELGQVLETKKLIIK